MKLVKGLFSVFSIAVMLLLTYSCGVPSPSTPTAIATPATMTTISRSDSIVILFSTAMSPGTLVLSGDVAAENAAVAWSETSIVNDTLTITPGANNGNAWPAGSLTLIVDVLSIKGAIFPTLTLNYEVEALVPAAVAVPASSATIIGSDFIVILFTETMDTASLSIQGDMATESDNGTWSKSNSENDTLVIRPGSAWSGNASTLIIDADSVDGASLPTLTLNYTVDTTVPVITAELPADGAAIKGSVPIVISFSKVMKPLTLNLSGSLVANGVSDGGIWSSSSKTDDTLTISPIGGWTDGSPHTLIIDVDALNGKSLATATLNYTVDTTFSIDSVTPAPGDLIMGSENIVIDFDAPADISTLVASGSLCLKNNNNNNDCDNGVWSNNNFKLTLSPFPSGAWPAGPIDLTLDVVYDLIGNSITPLSLNYTVDTGTPTISLVGANPVPLSVGDSYTDAGATANDDVDGDITANITIVNPVNTAAVGSYTITYNVSDTAGNPALEVTRTVNVSDGGAPVITLLGSSPVNLSVGDSYTDAGATAADNVDASVTVVVGGDTVNTAAVGTYVITYDATDAAGNPAAQVTRTVNVADNTPPVITLTGSTPINLSVGDSYTDAGATATDNVDASITVVVGGDTVNTAAVGTYVITYDATDAAGNPATQVTRTVNVADNTPPVITLTGSTPVNLSVGDSYTDAGATATDNVDVSVTVVVGGATVNTAVIGSYVITYDATDAAGNPATQITRTVNVADSSAPIITLLGTDPVNLSVGDSYTDAGAIAMDDVDGDISTSIVIGGNIVNVNVVGTYIITYNVSDTANNAAIEITRTVNVADNTPPVIILTGSTPVNLSVGDSYTDAGATATDNVDASVTVNVGGDVVNTAAVGTYVITYDATDAAGNPAIQITRTVNVADNTPPVITLTGSTPINLSVGDSYTDAGATATDNVDASVTVNVGGDVVNTTAVGTYVITYDATDAAGNPATQVTRTVNVADNTPPVITLTGSTPVNLSVGDSYTDAGATATDNVDASVTVVVGGATVNTAVIGTYVITYDATDAAGNSATQVTRTVNVADNTPPVITLTGSTPINLSVGDSYTDAGATATDNVDASVTVVVGGATVNTAIVGTYIITYDATDAAGNSATQVTRTVNVADNTPPVITLTGSTPINLSVGDSYTDAGATATDNVDASVTVVIGGDTVNTAAVGVYVITYDATDAAGNPATQVTRTVNVADNTPPVITLTGSDPVDVTINTSYTDAGATALDNVDGNISANIIVGGAVVDITTIGTYVITYNVSDAAFNAAVEVTRTVNVTAAPDTTPPVITLTGSTPVNLSVGDSYTDAGATATDNVDASVTVVVGGDTVNTAAVGTYVITYDATDAAGNSAIQVTRTVNVADNTPPVITITGSSPINLSVGDSYIDAGATATDNVDASVTVVVGGDTVNTAAVGTYVITYDATDAAGNSAIQVTRTVNVADTTAPVITLLGSDPVNLTVGDTYTEAGATASDNVDGDISTSIVVAGDVVDVNTIGTYVITYNVSDAAFNAAVEVTRTVNVTTAPDITPPVITLTGSTPVSLSVGDSYTDAGATATDNVDVTVTVVVGGDTVNTAVVGTYVITYDATDAAGNSAIQVTRTVNVADNTPPVITLTGSTPVNLSVGDSYTDAGATATDNVDASVTVVVGGDTVNTAVVGTYVITYNATDAAGNLAIQVTRTVNVADNTPPVITLTGSTPVNLSVGDSYIDAGATATDNVDASVTVVVGGDTVNTATVGTYVITYDATDAAGNSATQVTRTINVADTTAPVITLLGSDPVNLTVGGTYTEAGATATDNVDASVTVVVGGDTVNTAVVGTYVITYDATDAAGNLAIQVTRTVNVNP